MTTKLKRTLLSAAVAGALATAASGAYAYSLPSDWKIKFGNFETFTQPDFSALSPACLGVGALCGTEAGTVEDGWGIFRITTIENDPAGPVVWSDGDGGQHLYGIFWGFDTGNWSLTDPDVDGIPDTANLDQHDATLFTDGLTAIPDLDGDGSPDAGLAIFLGSADTFAAAEVNGPGARDLTSLADGVPDFAGITCADGNADGVCNDGDDYALQAIFQMATGQAASCIAGGILGCPAGQGLPVARASTTLTTSGPLVGTIDTGVADGFLDLVNKDLTASYDGTSPYTTPFDNVVLDSVPTNILGLLRDADFKFNVSRHPSPGDPNNGWTFNSEDPVLGHAVPEPSILALLGLGFTGLGFAQRMRRKG
jgi:hypothetical protein